MDLCIRENATAITRALLGASSKFLVSRQSPLCKLSPRIRTQLPHQPKLGESGKDERERGSSHAPPESPFSWLREPASPLQMTFRILRAN
jgi:hypothetical protein